MADPGVRIVVACALALAACVGQARAEESPSPEAASVPVATDLMSSQSRSPSYEAGRRDASAQAQRVQLSTEMGCIDTSTQLQLSESVKASIGDLGSLINDPRYRPLQVIWRTPVARYPAELLRAGAPGAVGLLLYINTEGRVARTEVVCATDPAFVALAEQVVRRNRYSPSTFDGKPIQDVAYQVIAYGVEAD